VRETGRALGLEVRITYLPYRPLWLACAAVEGLCRPLGIEPPLFRRRAEWFRQTRAFTVDKARRELGFEPRVPLAEGLRQTAVWYREHGYL
jgi:nucleoside-diphosphate-sugar epimerase